MASAQRIGGGTGEHRHADQADAEDSKREQQEGEIAGQRPQRAGRLRGGIDVGDAGHMKRDGGRENDEIGGEIGIKHAAPGVPLDAAEFRVRGRGIMQQRRAFAGPHVLHFFGCLPEK